ncbi:MAG: hypothetical protein NTW65_13405 [Deltaproteobacteria bacterium]|nr:hypothetical protein [Deltaproteobacteria bacterium]
MKYRDILQAVDTEKALTLIGITTTNQGAYIKFPCLKCENTAIIKAYGDKKNLYYCPECKNSGHIISLAMEKNKLDWQAANNLLASKAVIINARKITEELNINYELLYHEYLKNKGILKETCECLEIGVPKGKTMLAGSVAFGVRDENGMKVAYYGIRMKDEKPVYHKSFNPEMYLYNFDRIDKNEIVYFTTDMFKCIGSIENGRQCICNFGLPYLSLMQLELLNDIERTIVLVDETLIRTVAIQLAEYHRKFYHFE